MFNQGISRSGELVDLAAEHDIIKKSGAWYSYGEQRIGQGRENAKGFLDENPDLAEEIEAQVRRAMGLTPDSEEPDAPEAAAEDSDESKDAKKEKASAGKSKS